MSLKCFFKTFNTCFLKTAANRCCFGLKTHKKSCFAKSIKVQLHKTWIMPVLTYASETWALDKANEHDLQCFERKILGRIYGPKCVDSIWRTRYNYELYTLIRNPDISKCIKISRLRWARHLTSMKEEILKRIIMLQPDGQRGRVRPKLQWIDGLHGDAVALGMRN
ncbi:hypothetical protein C0J52_07135 [Blattella germanica]|nr:hypothetical protein C0J52_07135 [Blattella germanica]